MTPKAEHICGPFRNGRCVRCLRVQGIDMADPSGSGRDTSSGPAGAGSQGSADNALQGMDPAAIPALIEAAETVASCDREPIELAIDSKIADLRAAIDRVRGKQ